MGEENQHRYANWKVSVHTDLFELPSFCFCFLSAELFSGEKNPQTLRLGGVDILADVSSLRLYFKSFFILIVLHVFAFPFEGSRFNNLSSADASYQ